MDEMRKLMEAVKPLFENDDWSFTTPGGHQVKDIGSDRQSFLVKTPVGKVTAEYDSTGREFTEINSNNPKLARLLDYSASKESIQDVIGSAVDSLADGSSLEESGDDWSFTTPGGHQVKDIGSDEQTFLVKTPVGKVRAAYDSTGREFTEIESNNPKLSRLLDYSASKESIQDVIGSAVDSLANR